MIKHFLFVKWRIKRKGTLESILKDFWQKDQNCENYLTKSYGNIFLPTQYLAISFNLKNTDSEGDIFRSPSYLWINIHSVMRPTLSVKTV